MQKGKRYYFGVWVKADEKGGGLLWLHQNHPSQDDKLLPFATTGGKWRHYVIPDVLAVVDNMLILLENGTVLFDDVVFRECK